MIHTNNLLTYKKINGSFFKLENMYYARVFAICQILTFNLEFICQRMVTVDVYLSNVERLTGNIGLLMLLLNFYT